MEIYYIIIDTLTKVIVGSSNNKDFKLPETQSFVELSEKFDPTINPTVKFWKLDDKNNPIPADQIDIDSISNDSLAIIDPQANEVRIEKLKQNYFTTIEVLTTDGSLSVNLKNFFVALLNYDQDT